MRKGIVFQKDKFSNRFLSLTQIALLMSSSLSIIACDSQKKLDDMHESTVKMEKTTKSMSQETKQMNKTTRQMAEQTGKMVDITTEMQKVHQLLLSITNSMDSKMTTMVDSTGSMQDLTTELYQVAKHGSSMQLRRESMNGVRDTKIFSRKIAEGMKYFMAFEFQIWMGTGEDDQAKREQLMQLGLMEFFAEIEEFVTSDETVVDPFKNMDENQSFLALAVAAEAVDQRQMMMAKRYPQVKVVSMLNLIQEGLIASKQVNAGKARMSDYPLWVRTVMDNETMAIKLLKARANGYLLMFVGRASGIQHGKGDQIKTVLLKRAWDVNLAELNIATVSEYNRYLEEAIAARKLVKFIGKKSSEIVDPGLEKILAKANVIGLKKAPKKAASSANSENGENSTLGVAAEEDEAFSLQKAFVENLNHWR